MSRQRDAVTDPISNWLDAFVAGKSTPRPESASDPELSALCATANQFHGLAHAGARYAASVSTLPATWEELMSTNAAAMSLSMLPPKTSRRVAELAPPVVPTRHIGASSWNGAINIALAAALILAISAGIWRATGGFIPGFGDNRQPPTIPFGGAVSQDDGIDPAELPTAEDCTVEPLTVDEVIAILQDPNPSAGWPIKPTMVNESATPTKEPVAQGFIPSQETIDSAAETQRMWMACALAASHFQRWALETSTNVQQQFTTGLPRLTGEDEARAILEELEREGSSSRPALQPIPPFNDEVIVLVDPDPRDSWELSSGFLVAGNLVYDSEGNLISQRSAQESREFAQMTGGRADGSCSTITMEFSPERDSWLIDNSGVGCG